MVDEHVKSRVQSIVALREAAEAAFAKQDYPSAREKFAACEQQLRSLIADDPQESAHTQALGSVLYAWGEAELNGGAAPSSAAVLQRAEEAYGKLSALGRPAQEVDPLIADVRIRRARALAIEDRAASALVLAQQAAVFHLQRASASVPREMRALDLARTLAWNAWVTAHVGDPDLAAASADVAIRQYQSLAPLINQHVGLKALHVPTFALAARVAAVVHGAYGRKDIAASAARLAEATQTPSSAAWQLPSEAALRSAVTLDQALAHADATALREQLVVPATECAIRVPAERISLQMAPLVASQLAKLSIKMSGHRQASLRISLEAHALFAAGSESLGQRFRFDDVGVDWTLLLHAMGRASQQSGRAQLAQDCAQWLLGIALNLVPLMPLLSAEARSAAQGALQWAEQVAQDH